MDFSLSAYRIFNSVAKLGSISGAAKELYISQPAISKAIAKLEQDLSVSLFIRGSRGVKLTEEGAQLYEHTKAAFETLKEGEELMKRNKSLGVGHIRIGVSTTLCKYLLLPYLKEFVANHPHIRFTIQCQSTFQTLELLEEGKLDLGLIGKPEPRKDLDFYSVGTIEDVFISTRSYLDNLDIREGKMLTNQQLFEKANLMLLDEKNITRVFIDDYFKKNGIRTGQILEVSNMDLLIEFAKTGIGIACVIKEFVKNELEDGSLIQIDLEVPIETREVGFAYRLGKQYSDSTLKFIEFYKGQRATSKE
nr:LysR family transcriptional regulator [Clostridium sp. Marseille-P299]